MRYELTDEVECPDCGAAPDAPCIRYGVVSNTAGQQVVLEYDEDGPVALEDGRGRPIVHGYRQRVIYGEFPWIRQERP